jgi:hypothetical protein
LGGVSCEKENPITETRSQKQEEEKLWTEFLSRVEKDEQEDPLGQYVSKKHYLKSSAGSSRPVRPKYNDYERSIEKKANGKYSSNKIAPDEPCETGGCGGGGYIPPTFVSSENQGAYSGPDNPDGYIYDLKLVGNTRPDPAPPGYTRLYADLNEGAGGAYIYLTFVRNPADVQRGEEIVRNRIYSSGPVTGIEIKTGCCSAPDPELLYYPIWWWNTYGWNYYKQLDLNNGAYGSYIWSYQTKEPSSQPIEVGILTGDNDRIQPPIGWTRLNTDLNQGAGGKFIYLCTKRR